MENRETIKFEYKNGVIDKIIPCHHFVSSWVFDTNELKEASFCNEFAILAEKNGMGVNEVMHAFPMVLRILKSKSEWSN